MWLLDKGSEEAAAEGDESSESTPGRSSALDRYRMYGRFYERYWSRLFGVTEADLAHLASHIRAQGEALTLTEMVRYVIRLRLRDGPQLRSSPASDRGMPAVIVRQWDPAATWRPGDRAIVVVPATVSSSEYVPRIGEILHVRGGRAVVQVDGMAAEQVYTLGAGAYLSSEQPPDPARLDLGARRAEDGQVDFVLWRHGSTVVTRLLHALTVDPRFVQLEGLWYLDQLAVRIAESLLARLARTMFRHGSGALRVDDALGALSLEDGRIGLRFGLAKALNARTDLFANVGSASHPRWALAGPPPGQLVATHAAYDPDSYVILCLPGQTLTPEIARRLWDTDLLRAVLAPAPKASITTSPGAATGPDQAGVRDSARPRRRKPLPRFLSRWLRLRNAES